MELMRALLSVLFCSQLGWVPCGAVLGMFAAQHRGSSVERTIGQNGVCVNTVVTPPEPSYPLPHCIPWPFVEHKEAAGSQTPLGILLVNLQSAASCVS